MAAPGPRDEAGGRLGIRVSGGPHTHTHTHNESFGTESSVGTRRGLTLTGQYTPVGFATNPNHGAMDGYGDRCTQEWGGGAMQMKDTVQSDVLYTAAHEGGRNLSRWEEEGGGAAARAHGPSGNKDAERQGSYGARASFKRRPYGMAHVRKNARCPLLIWVGRHGGFEQPQHTRREGRQLYVSIR